MEIESSNTETNQIVRLLIMQRDLKDKKKEKKTGVKMMRRGFIDLLRKKKKRQLVRSGKAKQKRLSRINRRLLTLQR